jgi:catalase
VEQCHIANAFRFELSKVTVPAIRERTVAMLRNASEQLAQEVADGLGMELPNPLPLALPNPATPEVTKSPSLSLLARPGDPDAVLRGRKVALLVAPGVQAAPLLRLQQALLEQGAVGRLVGPRIGPMTTADGDPIDADASLENEPGFLFDALVLPDGAEAIAALAQDGHTAEFIRDQFRHCKPILVFGGARQLLGQAGLPLSLDKAQAQGGTGLIVAEEGEEQSAAEAFLEALARHRHFGREMDPPLA